MMEGIGAEVSQKIRSAIIAKLMEIGVYVDEELPDYVMVMVANKRSKEQMNSELRLFLGKHTSLFTSWLHQVLQKLQEVTVANLGVKRRLSEDSKKKKKIKLDSDKKVLKNKIKEEPEDISDNNLNTLTINDTLDSIKDKHINSDVYGSFSKNTDTAERQQKENLGVTSVDEELKERGEEERTVLPKSNELDKASSPTDEQCVEQNKTGAATKSQDLANTGDDLEDEDCINIRTDGELLDTTEEPHIEDFASKSRDRSNSPDLKSSRKLEKKHSFGHTSGHISPSRSKGRESSTEKLHKRERCPSTISASSQTGKLVDARDVLNRKKAAKKGVDSDGGTLPQIKERSTSPKRKKADYKDDDRHCREDKGKRSGYDGEKESTINKDEKGSVRVRNREVYSSKRRDDRSRRTDSDCNKRKMERSSSGDRNTKSHKTDKLAESRKGDREADSRGANRNEEEPRKRVGLMSRVVPREPEPEEEVDTPVPSIVKVTPRPRRPPSQQPSSTLIIKAINEANRSLASAPPRPDTQRARKTPVYSRTLARIPPEKIAISISNPKAMVKGNSNEESNSGSDSPKNEEITDKTFSAKPEQDITSIEPGNSGSPGDKWAKEGDAVKERPPEDTRQSAEVLKPTDGVIAADEPLEESADPQFVVTLNGYDPDGLYSQSEYSTVDDTDGDEWVKDVENKKPLFTSTPEDTLRDHKPAANLSNLIEVEILKTKNTERCKYWPACLLGEKCTFYHPAKPCKLFPACKFGDSCLYIHPQCKFNTLCTRKDCVFSHTPALTPHQPLALVVPLYGASAAPLPCKFYPNCANINCQFAHPTKVCRYGSYCTKKDCPYHHGHVPPVDKLKWTRQTST